MRLTRFSVAASAAGDAVGVAVAGAEDAPRLLINPFMTTLWSMMSVFGGCCAGALAWIAATESCPRAPLIADWNAWVTFDSRPAKKLSTVGFSPGSAVAWKA